MQSISKDPDVLQGRKLTCTARNTKEHVSWELAKRTEEREFTIEEDLIKRASPRLFENKLTKLSGLQPRNAEFSRPLR